MPTTPPRTGCHLSPPRKPPSARLGAFGGLLSSSIAFSEAVLVRGRLGTGSSCCCSSACWPTLSAGACMAPSLHRLCLLLCRGLCSHLDCGCPCPSKTESARPQLPSDHPRVLATAPPSDAHQSWPGLARTHAAACARYCQGIVRLGAHRTAETMRNRSFSSRVVMGAAISRCSRRAQSNVKCRTVAGAPPHSQM